MYVLLLAYAMTSLMGAMTGLCIPLLVHQITGSAVSTSMTYALGVLPYLLVTPLGGVVGDFFNKKRLLQLGELVNATTALGLFFVPPLPVYLPTILALHFMLSAVVAFHHPVFQGIIPSLVPLGKVKAFNAWVGSLNNMISLCAPVLVALWLQLLSPREILGCLALGYGIAFVLVSSLAWPTQASSARPLGWAALYPAFTAGFSYLVRQPFLLRAVLFFFLTNLGSTCVQANLMHYFQAECGLSQSATSTCFAMIGAGALLGSCLAPRIMGYLCVGQILVASTVVTLLITLLIAGISSPSYKLYAPSFLERLPYLGAWASSTPRLVAALWGVASMCSGVVVVAFFTLRQRVVPADRLSRVVASTRMISYLAIPLSAMTSGLYYEYAHDFRGLALASACILLLALLTLGRKLLQGEPSI